GKIDDAGAMEGAPVVDAHDDRFTRAGPRHPRIAGNGQGGMGGRHGVHIVGFAVGGLFAMKFPSVPGCGAFLPERPLVADGNIALAENDIGPEIGRRMLFDARYGIRDGLDVGGYVRPRAVVLVVAAAPAAARAGAAGQNDQAQAQKGGKEMARRSHGMSGGGWLRCRISRGEWSAKRRASCSVT